MRAPILRLSLGLLCLGPWPITAAVALAKTGSARSAASQTVIKTPETAWTAAEPANCSRARRKLWQADQGWLVKTVTVCH